MKILTHLLVVFSLFIVMLTSQPLLAPEDFPLSIKGWQATVIRLEGVNTSRALAVGQVRKRNAEEYCDREAEWSKDKSGRKISKERCIRNILRKERGKFYSISADCPGKILRSNIGSFTLTGQSSETGSLPKTFGAIMPPAKSWTAAMPAALLCWMHNLNFCVRPLLNPKESYCDTCLISA